LSMKNSARESSDDTEQERFYLESLQDDLNEVESLILSYANGIDVNNITRVLSRKIHTIKGVAGGYGLELISVIAHRMEDHLALLNLTEITEEEKIHSLLNLKDAMTQVAQAHSQNDKETIRTVATQLGMDYEAQPKKQTTKKKTASHRLLLVDPSQVTLRMCIGALKNYQVEFVTEKNGYDALGRLLKEKFDSVVISMHAPLLSGPDLAFILKKIAGPNSRIPITVLTSDQSLGSDPHLTLLDKVIEKGQGLQKKLIDFYRDLVEAKSIEVLEIKKAPFRKLMLIDDSEHIHNLVKLALKKHESLEILAVSNPLEAFNKAILFGPELILLDAEMPELSGREVCLRLKKSGQTKNIPIFFLTAITDQAKTKELIDAGGSLIIQKPFSPKTFAQNIFELYSSKNGVV